LLFTIIDGLNFIFLDRCLPIKAILSFKSNQTKIHFFLILL